MRLLIATPLYPPQVGGPSKYAEGLERALVEQGHTVRTVAYGALERALPPGVRHLIYFLRLLPDIFRVDTVLALDAASVGVPAFFAARLAGRKFLIRLGGDFVWEQYVERTKKDITLKAFNEHLPPLSFKERTIYALCTYVLRRADTVIFNTSWFRDICVTAYHLAPSHTAIIENELPPHRAGEVPTQKNFLFVGRQIALKNSKRVHEAFAKAKETMPELVLEEGIYTPETLRKRLRACYAVLQPSLSDVAPNLVLEGLAHGKPFILTNETGLKDSLQPYGLFVDPLSVDDIADKILKLADDATYTRIAQTVAGYNRIHTFNDIAKELIALG